VERFNLKILSEVEGKEQHRVEILLSNRFAGLGILEDDENTYRARIPIFQPERAYVSMN
jgi:hypothetical protein